MSPLHYATYFDVSPVLQTLLKATNAIGKWDDFIYNVAMYNATSTIDEFGVLYFIIMPLIVIPYPDCKLNVIHFMCQFKHPENLCNDHLLTTHDSPFLTLFHKQIHYFSVTVFTFSTFK